MDYILATLKKPYVAVLDGFTSTSVPLFNVSLLMANSHSGRWGRVGSKRTVPNCH